MERRLAYDSDAALPGRCLGCGKRLDRCSCGTVRRAPTPNPPAKALPRDGVVRLSRDRKSRGGKTVTLIAGLPVQGREALASDLKRLCGAGGTLRGDVIEIQGEFRERLKVE